MVAEIHALNQKELPFVIVIKAQKGIIKFRRLNLVHANSIGVHFRNHFKPAVIGILVDAVFIGIKSGITCSDIDADYFKWLPASIVPDLNFFVISSELCFR